MRDREEINLTKFTVSNDLLMFLFMFLSKFLKVWDLLDNAYPVEGNRLFNFQQLCFSVILFLSDLLVLFKLKLSLFSFSVFS